MNDYCILFILMQGFLNSSKGWRGGGNSVGGSEILLEGGGITSYREPEEE